MLNKFLITGLFFLIIMSLTSCSVIGGIFKTGMGVGVFIVIAIIAIVIFAISSFTKK